jgi:hypothetical protein
MDSERIGMKRNSKYPIIILFVILIFLISGCSSSGLQIDFAGFFENLWLSFTNFWANIKQSLDNLMVSIGDMFSGLSGIGEAMRNMFRNFSIF